MYIVRQPLRDPMVLGTVEGHALTFAEAEDFLRATEEVLELAAERPCPLFPDDACMARLRFRKTGGLLRTRELGDELLEVSGHVTIEAYTPEDGVDTREREA